MWDSPYSVDDYLAVEEAEEWIIEDLLVTGGKVNLMGGEKLGKTFMALQLAEAISSPNVHTFLGHPIVRKGPVLYLQLDMPRALWKKRLRHLRAAHAIDHRNFRLQDQIDFNFHFDITQAPTRKVLRNKLRSMETWPVATFVDVTRSCHGGDEDNSAHMQSVINYFQDTLQDYDEPANTSALILISHTRKPSNDRRIRSQNEGSMHENRGSGAVNGSVDTLLKLVENRLYVESRSVEKFSVRLERDRRTGLWLFAPPETSEIQVPPSLSPVQLVEEISRVIADTALQTKRARRQALIERGASPEQAKAVMP